MNHVGKGFRNQRITWKRWEARWEQGRRGMLQEYLSIWNKLLGHGKQCKDIILKLEDDALRRHCKFKGHLRLSFEEGFGKRAALRKKEGLRILLGNGRRIVLHALSLFLKFLPSSWEEEKINRGMVMLGVTQSGSEAADLAANGLWAATGVRCCPMFFVTHYLAVAKWLGPNMQEITWELYLARWAHILIWLEAEADWINLGERQCVGSQQNISPQVSWGPLASLRFVWWTSLRAVTEGWRKEGFLVLRVVAQSKVAGPTSAAQRGQPWDK